MVRKNRQERFLTSDSEPGAHKEVGDNPSRRAIHKKAPPVFGGAFLCMLFWNDWFVIRFEKIAGSNFSRPTGARRVAHREVGDNPSEFTTLTVLN
jgi:hypothetical protein